MSSTLKAAVLEYELHHDGIANAVRATMDAVIGNAVLDAIGAIAESGLSDEERQRRVEAAQSLATRWSAKAVDHAIELALVSHLRRMRIEETG